MFGMRQYWRRGGRAQGRSPHLLSRFGVMVQRAFCRDASILLTGVCCLAVMGRGSAVDVGPSGKGGEIGEVIEGTVIGAASLIGERQVGIDVTNQFTLKRCGADWELRVLFGNGGNECWVHQDGLLYGVFDLPLSPESLSELPEHYVPPLNAVVRTGAFPNEGFVTTKFIWYAFAPESQLRLELSAENLILPWLQGMLPGARAFSLEMHRDEATSTRDLIFRHAESKWENEVHDRKRDKSQLKHRDGEVIGAVRITSHESTDRSTTATITRFHPVALEQPEATVPAIEFMLHARHAVQQGLTIDIPILNRETTVVDYRLGGPEKLLNVIYSVTNGLWPSHDDPAIVEMFAEARRRMPEVKAMLFPEPPKKNPLTTFLAMSVVVLAALAPLVLWIAKRRNNAQPIIKKG